MQPFAMASLFDAIAFLGRDPEAGRDLVQLARLHLAEPFGRRDALNRPPDAAVKPVGHALRQHVDLEPEVAAAADQVAQCVRPELVLGHRHGLVDDERRAARVGQQMGEQRALEDGEDSAAVSLVALVQVPDQDVGAPSAAAVRRLGPQLGEVLGLGVQAIRIGSGLRRS